MDLEVNIDVIPNSNPTSPTSEFLIEIPLDKEVPEPLPNTHCEVLAPVNNLESELSESDLSSYSFNYKSDSTVAANGPIYPILPLANYPDDEDNPKDDINWVKMPEDDVWFVPPLPLLRPGGQLNIISSGQEPENLRTFLMPYLMKQCGQL